MQYQTAPTVFETSDHKKMQIAPSLTSSSMYARIGIVAFCSLVYSAGLLLGNRFVDNAGTFLFLAITFTVLIKASLSNEKLRPAEIFWFAFIIPMGIVLPAALAGKAESFFWVEDSLSTHLPKAMIISDWITGKGRLIFNGDTYRWQGLITHIWVGTLITIFGKHAWVTVGALALIRAATCYVIAKLAEEIFESKKYARAFLLYVAAPTVLWHTLAFYKEATVQLFVALTLYGIFRLYRRPGLLGAVATLVGLGGGFVERFYLVLVFTPLLVFFVLGSLKTKRVLTSLVLVLALAAAFMYHPYFRFSFATAWAKLQELRLAHSTFADINFPYNYEIPYPVAVVKTMLTPIWTPNKSTIFFGPSALITWGSFFHEILFVFYVLGVVHAVRKRGYVHLVAQIPFIILILAIAYISPWAGRLRDSFYPLIAVYAFYYLTERFFHDMAALREAGRKLVKRWA